MITCIITFGTETDAKQVAMLATRKGISGCVRKGKVLNIKVKNAKTLNGLRIISQAYPSFKGFKTK